MLIVKTKQQINPRGLQETVGRVYVCLKADSIYPELMGVSRDTWVGRSMVTTLI